MSIPPFLAQLRQKIGSDLILVPTIVVIARDKDDRLLLVYDRDSKNWTLPGGIIEPGESPANAAVRELWEETHVHASLTEIIAVIGGPDCETHYKNGDRIAWVATVFGAQVENTTPVPDGTEIEAAKFVAPNTLATMDLRADTLRFLKAEQERINGAYFQTASWRPESFEKR